MCFFIRPLSCISGHRSIPHRNTPTDARNPEKKSKITLDKQTHRPENDKKWANLGFEHLCTLKKDSVTQTISLGNQTDCPEKAENGKI